MSRYVSYLAQRTRIEEYVTARSWKLVDIVEYDQSGGRIVSNCGRF